MSLEKKPNLISLGIDKIGQEQAKEIVQIQQGILELFSISKVELHELRKRILENGGTVRVFIHPFFYDYAIKYNPKGSRPSHNLDRIQILKNGIGKIIGKPSIKTPPVFMLEEQEHMDESKQIIKSEFHPEQPIYWIPTEPNSADPMIKNAIDSWEKLRKMFLYLGVKKVIIGGMYLKVVHGYDLDPDMMEYRKQRRKNHAKNMEYDLLKCVRGAVTGFSQDRHYKHVFDVEISNFNFPDSRNDITMKEGEPTYEDLYHNKDK